MHIIFKTSFKHKQLTINLKKRDRKYGLKEQIASNH